MSDELTPSLKAELLAEFEKDWRKELRRAVPAKERMTVSYTHLTLPTKRIV